MITAEQIKQLSTAEKLQVMETLWQELTAEGAEQLASPAWHQQVLQQTEGEKPDPEGAYVFSTEIAGKLTS